MNLLKMCLFMMLTIPVKMDNNNDNDNDNDIINYIYGNNDNDNDIEIYDMPDDDISNTQLERCYYGSVRN